MDMTTRELLLKHYKSFPCLQAEDIFKFLFQGSFGCEHLVSDEAAVLQFIKKEYAEAPKDAVPFTDELDGEYSRVYLSWLNAGLSPETLARLFCLSAKTEGEGKERLFGKLETARELIVNGEIPLNEEEFERKLNEWKKDGCPAIHHSRIFRSTYKPAYRVISSRFSEFLPIFAEIDRRLASGNVIVAIEGGSASGKTTLSEILTALYDCNIFHTDNFFLRPEQRTPERFSEIGGNLDRERFYEEVTEPLAKNEAVCYRPFDCSLQALGEPIAVSPSRLTIVEGVYSTHSYFGKYYDFSVFLDIEPELQKKRIEKRNSPALARRFFGEWIPLENIYFEKTEIKSRADLIIPIKNKSR